MEELNEMTVVESNEELQSCEGLETENSGEAYLDAGVVLAVGAIGGALALKGAQVIWNSNPARKGRAAVKNAASRVVGYFRSSREDQARENLVMVESEVELEELELEEVLSE